MTSVIIQLIETPNLAHQSLGPFEQFINNAFPSPHYVEGVKLELDPASKLPIFPLTTPKTGKFDTNMSHFRRLIPFSLPTTHLCRGGGAELQLNRHVISVVFSLFLCHALSSQIPWGAPLPCRYG